jgi:hypothetical protein
VRQVHNLAPTQACYCGGFERDERASMKAFIKINLPAHIKMLKHPGESVATQLSWALWIWSPA